MTIGPWHRSIMAGLDEEWGASRSSIGVMR
jgi:hypothetical protein